MTVHIGKRYIANLSRIRNLLISVASGGFQEETQIRIVKGRGTCYYDSCSKKSTSSERRLIINHETGNEGYAFHTECLEQLCQDKRLQFHN